MAISKVEELKWIDDDVLPRQPPIEEFPGSVQRVRTPFLTKMTENIFVPLGLIATTACLTLGLVNLTRGDKKKQQFYMKGRVGFQAFTLAAMTISMYYAGKKRKAESEQQSENK